MSQIRRRLRDAIAGARGDVKSLTKATFWAVLGSLATLYTVAPEAPLTRQILPLEIGLLVGMALVYLGYGRDE